MENKAQEKAVPEGKIMNPSPTQSRDFEKWAAENGMPRIHFNGEEYEPEEIQFCFLGWQARQSEIDALKQKLVDSIAETLSAQEAANNNAGIAMKAGCSEGLRIFAAITKNRNHPSHSVRYSDSSAYDEKCDQCGATDADQASLDNPCPTPVASHE